MRPNIYINKVDRESEILRVKEDLLKTGFPRIKMFFLVSLTGGAGFLSSVFMLSQGLTDMALRYPLVVGVSYMFFLGLLWLWIKTNNQDYLDIPNCSNNSSSSSSDAVYISNGCNSGSGNSGLSGVDVGGGDVEAIPIVIVIGLICILFSSMWIIYSAPVLFSELLIDGVLSATIYKKLNGIETHHWLGTAIKKTIIPFAITAFVVFLCGLFLNANYPSAKSIGDVLHYEYIIKLNLYI